MTEKWYIGRADDVAQTLETNPSAGLSPKVARARRRKEGDNDVFSVPNVSPLACAAYVCSDVSMLLLILTAVLAAIWGHGVSGAMIFGIAAIHSAAAIFTYVRSRRIIESMAVCTMPRVRVLRGGRVYAVDARMLVRGDVILLRPGDIVSCDARLFSSDGLTVIQYSGKLDGKAQRGRVKKDAARTFSSDESPALAAIDNMVFAGSVVVSGEGRALAVEMGRNTFFVSTEGKIPLTSARDRMPALEALGRYCGRSALFMLLLILPLTVLGVLCTDATLNLLDYFLLSLALAVSSMSELTAAIGYIIVGCGLLRAARGNAYTDAAASEDTAIIPHPEDLSALARADRLVLFDDTALTEGRLGVCAAWLGREALLLEADSVALREVLETALISSGLASSSAISVDSAADDRALRALFSFAEAHGVTAETVRSHVHLIDYAPTGDGNPFSTALLTEGGAISAICAGDAASLLTRCTRVADPASIDGTALFRAEEKDVLLAACNAETALGGYAVAYARRSSPYNTLQRLSVLQEELILVGILIFRDPVSPTVPGAICALADAGTRTVLMADHPAGGGSIEMIARAAGILKNGVICRSPEPISPDAELCIGYDAAERAAYLDALRAAGETVVGLGSRVGDVYNLQHCTLSAACTPVSCSDRRENRLLDSLDPASGTYYGTEVLKKTAGLLVRRAGTLGGGVSAVLAATRIARRIELNLAAALRCLLSAQAMRICLVPVLVFLGIPALTPLQLLVSGLILDFGAIIACAFDRGPDRPAPSPDFFSRPIRACLPFFLLGVFCGGGSALLAYLLSRFGILVGNAQISGFVFLSLVLTQVVFFFVCRSDADFFGGSRIGLLWPISVLLFAILCGFSPVVMSIFGIEPLPLAAACSLAVSPVIAAFAGAIIRIFTGKDEETDDSTEDYA